jgi:GNAT superfamily N-acetyltransferase
VDAARRTISSVGAQNEKRKPGLESRRVSAASFILPRDPGARHPGGQGYTGPHGAPRAPGDVAMPAFTLRPARRTDADALAALFIASRRAGIPDLPEIHSDEETFDFIRDTVLAECQVVVADVGGDPVGFVALDDGWVEHLYVAPDWHRRGIGDALLAEAKRRWPAGLDLYTFAANAAARTFYEQRGFVAVDFRDGAGNEEGLPDVRYAWRP